MSQPDQKQLAFDLLKSLETNDPKPFGSVSTTKYIQHNLNVADGPEGLSELFQRLPRATVRVKTARTFQDGAFVFAHTDYNFFGPKIGFDIFRFEGGKIVEHWDNLQETPELPNSSGHTMTDGPTEATDLEKTEANKKLARSFIEDVFVNVNLDKFASYFDGDNYIQHNPRRGDGAFALSDRLRAMAKQGTPLKFDKIHRVLGEGNFVLTVGEGQFAGKDTSFYDLWRVENGKIAEHWDTVEAIPEKGEWKNSNGKF